MLQRRATLVFWLLGSGACASNAIGDPSGSTTAADTLRESTVFDEVDANDANPGDPSDYYANKGVEYEVLGSVRFWVNPAYADSEFVVRTWQQKAISAVADSVNEKFGQGPWLSLVMPYWIGVREDSGEASNLRVVGGGYFDVDFRILVAGSQQMLRYIESLPGHVIGQNGRAFELPIHGIRAPNGETIEQTAVATIEPIATPSNSYPRYNDFTADGVYDITVLFGSAPYAEIALRSATVAQLYLAGFRSEGNHVYTRTLQIGTDSLDEGPGERTIRVEIRLLRPEDLEDPQAERSLVFSEMRNRDVVMYWGHAAAGGGFDFGNLIINYNHLQSMTLDAKQQLFVIYGCETYSTYADLFSNNLGKTGTNSLDVITAGSYAAVAVSPTGVLEALTHGGQDGAHVAHSYQFIVNALDSALANRATRLAFGVHFVRDNPSLNPYATLSRMGQPCTSSDDCGFPYSNVCATRNHRRFCAPITLSSAGCPETSTAQPYSSGFRYIGDICIPPGY